MTERVLKIKIGSNVLIGDLSIPHGAQGLVLFSHGSGSSRGSPRNKFVARALNAAGIATLLTDLLTVDEERLDRVTSQFRFDIDLLAQRLLGITDWVLHNQITEDLMIGYFGASTGAAAALIAAVGRPGIVRAIVSRGGRPDLAGEALPNVKAPTLLIVGGKDEDVIRLNETAFERLTSTERKLKIVPGATHLFEEPGKLGAVAILATSWFKDHLVYVEHSKAAG